MPRDVALSPTLADVARGADRSIPDRPWWRAGTGLAGVAVLAAGLLAVPELRAEREQERRAVARQAQVHRQAVLAVFADVEKVLDPVLLAAEYDGPAAALVRLDVYTLGEVDRDLEDRLAALDKAPAAPTSLRAAYADVRALLSQAATASRALEQGTDDPAASAEVDRLKKARDDWQAVLREDFLTDGQQLPSATRATVGTTRAASLLRFDSVCDGAAARTPPVQQPRSPADVIRRFEDLDSQLSLLISGLLGVEVPGYEAGYVETSVVLPGREVLDRITPLTARVTAALRARDRAALTDALAGYGLVEERLRQIGEGLETYGATVCGEYFLRAPDAGADPTTPV